MDGPENKLRDSPSRRHRIEGGWEMEIKITEHANMLDTDTHTQNTFRNILIKVTNEILSSFKTVKKSLIGIITF